jgi:hypothetical protein
MGIGAVSLRKLVAGVVVVASLGLASSAGAGAPARVQVGAAPRVPHGAKALGEISSNASITGAVVLQPRDNAALQQFIAQVSDPSSPQFEQYLPAGAFAGRFGPTQATIDAVRSQLEAEGLQVGGVSGNGLLMRFTAPAHVVQSAFHTTLENYRRADGTTGRQTTSAVEVPAPVAPDVAAVIGLNNLVHTHALALTHSTRSAGTTDGFTAAKSADFAHPAGAPTACAAAKRDATKNGGLTDDQIANAYGAFGLYGAGDLGAGQRIAIYENEPFLPSDIDTFDTCFFGASQAAAMMNRLTVTPVDGGQPTGPGSGEASLDVENVSAIAPDAHIDVYEGPFAGDNADVYDSLDEYTAIIDADRDQEISTSWGVCEQLAQQGQPGLQAAENLLFEQAAAQGQSVFSSSGDNGSDDCNTFETPTPASGQNPVSVDDPSSQPYVVSVGGTTITDAATQPAAEQVWNDGANGGGGGGGISQSWAMPAWQQASTVPGIALPGSADYTNANSVEQSFGYASNFCQSTVAGADAATPCRLVPDVSAQADEFTGAITVYSVANGGNGWSTIGGTSSSAPLWAAMTALVNSSAACTAHSATAHGVGFVSPLLYAVASRPAEYAASFNDITNGNNDTYGLDDGLVFPSTTGYDLASGLGSPQLTGPGGTAGLAYYLCNLGVANTNPTVAKLAPSTGSTAGGEKITITGSGFAVGGKPDVNGIQVGTFHLSSNNFTVNSATSITATLPPARDTLPPGAPAPQDGAGPADVIVILNTGASSAPGPGSVFQYVDTTPAGGIPSVTGTSPSGGLEAAPAPITILGSGFTGTTRVTFGGVAAPKVSVLGPNEISVTPPQYSSSTACAPLPSTGVFVGENASNDICQVQVRVSNAAGTSAIGHILPPPEGTFALSNLGTLVLPPGCDCEQGAAPTEYDYVPAPRVSSISTSGGPASLASEAGTSVVTATGVGFDPLAIDWADFGDPQQADSQDINYAFVSGTELQVIAPPQTQTVDPATVPFSVKTLGGQSNSATALYAGVPTISSVVNTSSSTELNGVYGGPDTGGTPITVTGQGFADQLVAPLQFVDTEKKGDSDGTQYTFTVNGDTSLSTETVSQNPALVDVEACTVSGCSTTSPADEFWLYPPGNPQVDAIKPSSGPAAGDTPVAITGENLSCPISALFGKTAAETVKAVATPGLDCGSSVKLKATSPAGIAGSTVPVTVQTVESYFTGAPTSPTTANFTYGQ